MKPAENHDRITDEFRTSFENASVAKIMADPYDLSILRINTACSTLFGLSQDEMLEHSLLKFCHPADAQLLESGLLSLVSGGSKSFKADLRFSRDDLHENWFGVSAYLLQNASGRPMRIALLLHDITERQLAEKRLMEDLSNTQLLLSLGTQLPVDADISKVYEAILKTAISLTRADGGTIQIVDDKTGDLVIEASEGLPDALIHHFRRVTSSSRSSCGSALAKEKRIIVHFDETTERDSDGSANLHLDAGYYSAQSTPLISRSGKPVGMLSTHWRQHHQPEERVLHFLDLLARKAAAIIEQRMLAASLKFSQETLAKELADTELLRSVSSLLISDEESEIIYREIVTAAMKLLGAEMGTIQLLIPGEQQMLELLYSSGFSQEAEDYWKLIPARASSIYVATLSQGSRVVIPDMEKSDGIFSNATELEFIRGCGIRALQATPLLSRDGSVVAIISTYWKSPYHPQQKALQLFDILARQAADLIDRRNTEVKLRRSSAANSYRITLEDSLRPLTSPPEIHTLAARLLGQHLGASRCYYASLGNDGNLTIHDDYRNGVPSISGTKSLKETGISGGIVDGDIHPTVINDVVKSSFLSKGAKESFKNLESLSATMCAIYREGHLRAILGVHYTTPHHWTREELALVKETANRAQEAEIRADAEKSRLDRQHQLQTLLDTAPLGVFLVDSNFCIRSLNPTAVEVMGTLQDVVGETLESVMQRIWPPTLAEQVVRRFHHTLNTGESYTEIEVSEIRKDRGVTEHYEWEIHRIRLPDDTNGVVCYFQDISLQIENRTRVTESEAKYQALFNSVDEGFCLIELIFDQENRPVDYRFVEVNAAFKRLTGIHDPIGKTALEIIPDLEEWWIETYGRIALTGESVRFENYAAPMHRWFDVFASRLGGEDSHTVALIFNNITDRKLRERNLVFLNELSSGFINLQDSTNPLQLIGERLKKHFGFNELKLIEFNTETGETSILYHDKNGIILRAGGCRITEYFSSEHLERLMAGETVAVEDVTSAGIPHGGAAFEEHGISSILCAPYLNHGKLKFLIGGIRTGVSRWRADEIDFLRELTAQIYLRLERHRAEEALRTSEERMRIAIDSAEMGTWDWDIVNDVVKWDEQHFRLMGLPPRNGDVALDYFRTFVHPEDLEQLIGLLNKCVESALDYQSEFRIIRPDNGEIRWLTGSGKSFQSEDGRSVRMSGVIYDSTERKLAADALQRAHDELEERVNQRTQDLADALNQVRAETLIREEMEHERMDLLKRLVTTQEEERHRISRELHDNLGQHMVAVMLGLESLRNGGIDKAGSLEKLRSVVDQFNTAVRRQAWELRPAELDHLGLNAALAHYVGDWTERTGIPVDFNPPFDDADRLDPDVEIAFYRIVQESLTNVARHANASSVKITLSLASSPELKIEDDGCGFDLTAVKGRLGLLGMKERLAIVNGTLTVDSTPGKGTRIIASL